MSVQDIQFQKGDTEDTRLKKLRQLVEELIRISRRSSSSGGGGGTLPESGARVVLATASTTFPNGEVLTAGSGLQITHATGLLTIDLNAVPLSKLAEMPQGYLLGRYDAGTGSVQLVRIGAGLVLVGNDLRSTGNGYPKQLGYARI